MYSKYLDYSEATHAHHTAMDDNRTKDLLISQLKNQTNDLRQVESDFARLTSSISALQDKFNLLSQERDRMEREWRVRGDQDKSCVLSLREEVDRLRVQLQQCNLQIEDYLRENTNLKRMCDGRATQMQALVLQNKEIGNRNQRTHDENRNMGATLKAFKEERKQLEDECDALSANLDREIARLKSMEKEIRNIESGNTKLQKTLGQAEYDHKKLVEGSKSKEQDNKNMENKCKSMQNALKEAQISNDHAEQQIEKSNREYEKVKTMLDNEMGKGKQLSDRLTETEIEIKAQENELDEIIIEEEQLRRRHFGCLDRNKKLNMEIDSILSLISEYEVVNRELLDEIGIMVEQDEQAKEMLSRKDVMRDIIETALRKIATTEEPIRHLKG